MCMQLFIRHQISESLVLPISYNHILQAIIYGAISDQKYAQYLHDTGYTYQSKNYKFFQYSRLNGAYRVSKGKIVFVGTVWFEVRSIFPGLILNLKRHIEEEGITYLDQHFDEVETCLQDDTIESETLVANMITPVTVHITDPSTKKTYFPPPGSEAFISLIKDNFKRKYEAYTGVVPETDIDIHVMSCEETDKLVVKYKNFYIDGWFGTYLLSGKRKYLDFLFQCGIGDRNSQGFGMFDAHDY